MIALLKDGYVDLSDTMDIEKGVVHYYDETIRDSENHGYTKVTVKKAFEISSNAGISKLVHSVTLASGFSGSKWLQK